MIVFVVTLAWAAMRFYDTPVRAWLGRRAGAKVLKAVEQTT